MDNEGVYILSKELYVEMAHRLGKGYKGKCMNVHGHSWKITINVIGSKLDSMGMLVDYKEIKEKLANEVDRLLDHKLVLQKDDPFIPLLKNDTEVFTMDENPTSENLARFLFDYLSIIVGLEAPYKIYSIEVGETCTSSCIFTRNSNYYTKR